jgi:hypothetical protein
LDDFLPLFDLLDDFLPLFDLLDDFLPLFDLLDDFLPLFDLFDFLEPFLDFLLEDLFLPLDLRDDLRDEERLLEERFDFLWERLAFLIDLTVRLAFFNDLFKDIVLFDLRPCFLIDFLRERLSLVTLFFALLNERFDICERLAILF